MIQGLGVQSLITTSSCETSDTLSHLIERDSWGVSSACDNTMNRFLTFLLLAALILTLLVAVAILVSLVFGIHFGVRIGTGNTMRQLTATELIAVIGLAVIVASVCLIFWKRLNAG